MKLQTYSFHYFFKVFLTPSLLFFSLSFPGKFLAQSVLELFINVENSQLGFTEGDSIFYENIISIPSVESHEFVRVGNVMEMQNGGWFDFAFSFEAITDTFRVLGLDVKYNSADDYIWKGEIPERGGGLIIVKKPGGTSGMFFFDSLLYEITGINDSISVLTGHGLIENPYTCGDTIALTASGNDDCEGDGCAALITILLLLPEDARLWLVDTIKSELFLITMVEKLNLAFQRSNISHRARIVVSDFDWDYPNAYMSDDVIDLMKDEDAKDIREQLNADLVMMLTTVPYNDDYHGIVARVNPPPDSAFSIVRLNFALGIQYVFVHEIGHLFGAGHEYGPPNPKSDCNYAWDIIPQLFATVMRTGVPYPEPPFLPYSHRVLNFSDPEVYFLGEPTGSYYVPPSPELAGANNAGRIRATGCEVAGFVGDTEMIVMIEGDNFLCDEPEHYTAVVTSLPDSLPGQPPYSYEWHWNYDGIFTPQSPGNLLSDTTIQLSIPQQNFDPNGCTFLFLHVKVTSSDNINSQAVKRIYTSCAHCPYTLLDDRSRQEEEVIFVDTPVESELRIYPNPARSQIHFEYDSEKEDVVKIVLVSLTGDIIFRYQNLIARGNNKFSINIDGKVPDGMYLLKYATDSVSASSKIIILK